MSLPRLGSLAGEQPQSVDDVLASYDHSNTINLFALGALVAWLRGETAAEGEPGREARDCRRRTSSLPKLASAGGRGARNLGAGAAAQPLRRSAARSSWPACTAISRMRRRSCGSSRRRWRRSKADGSLARAIAANRADAARAGEGAWRARSMRQRPPLRRQIEAGVSAFVDHAIGKMVTICRAIRVARTSHARSVARLRGRYIEGSSRIGMPIMFPLER